MILNEKLPGRVCVVQIVDFYAIFAMLWVFTVIFSANVVLGDSFQQLMHCVIVQFDIFFLNNEDCQ